MPVLRVVQTVNARLPLVLNSRKTDKLSKCQNKISNNCNHWRENLVQKLKKAGIEPTAELVNHCLSMWFWQECTTTVPYLTSTFNALPRTNKSRYPLAMIIIKFTDGMHLISLKSCFDACLECQVTVLSKLNFKKVLIFGKKVFTSWIQTYDLLNAGQLLYPLSYMAVVFNGMLLEFSPLLPDLSTLMIWLCDTRFQPLSHDCLLISQFPMISILKTRQSTLHNKISRDPD